MNNTNFKDSYLEVRHPRNQPLIVLWNCNFRNKALLSYSVYMLSSPCYNFFSFTAKLHDKFSVRELVAVAHTLNTSHGEKCRDISKFKANLVPHRYRSVMTHCLKKPKNLKPSKTTQSFFLFCFVFWGRMYQWFWSLFWHSLCRLGWPPPQGSTCLCLPSAGIKGVRHRCPT